MGIVNINIIFNQQDADGATFVAGRLVTGTVVIVSDTTEIVNVVAIKIKGEAVLKWNRRASKEKSRDSLTVIKKIFKIEQFLLNKESVAVPPGEHRYPFAILIPHNAPPSFVDDFGGIFYYAKVKIHLPWGVDCKKRAPLQIKNMVNLNNLPLLRKGITINKTRKFKYLRCRTTGVLTIHAHVPKTGFVKHDTIPIILEINKKGKVPDSSVVAHLVQIIKWKLGAHHNEKTKILKSVEIGKINVNVSRIWIANMILPADDLPCIKYDDVISITYEIQIKTNFENTKSGMCIPIPITIGDLPFQRANGLAREDSAISIHSETSQTLSQPQEYRNPVAESFQEIPLVFTSLLTLSETRNTILERPLMEYM